MIKRALIGGSMVAASLALFLHTYLPIETSAIAVVEDFTDMQVAKPSYQDVETILRISDNKWDRAVLYYSTLTDVSLNQSSELILPGRRQCLSNEFARQKELLEFEGSINELFSTSTVRGKKNSSVYVPIIKALSHLEEIEALNKTLLVYSDLMENTDDISLYDPKVLTMMKNKPDSIYLLYEEKMAIPDLTGITIYFIYSPTNTIEDSRFQIVSGFYKEIFEDHGAKVLVQANI